MKVTAFFSLIILVMLTSCEKEYQDAVNRIPFYSFSSTGQTLPAAINSAAQEVEFEIGHDVDITKLVPSFQVPDGCTVLLNGVAQVSGSSVVDFSLPVTYELKDRENRTSSWKAAAVPLKRRIVIDASHDGGVWWFPQGRDGFDWQAPHQGKKFADLLRERGYEVDEIGRGAELTEKMFFGHYIIIRAGGFQLYTENELKVYSNLLKRGMNLVFFTDHKKYDREDELGDMLGLQFRGIAYGVVATVKPHLITKNITSIDYNAGSVLTDYETNPDIEILGWLRSTDYGDLNMNGSQDAGEPAAPPVMGILSYPKSKVFFIGDMNGIEVLPEPFIDNMIEWMGDCLHD